MLRLQPEIVSLIIVLCISTFVGILCYGIIWSYLNSKPLGMRTLLDQEVKDLIQSLFWTGLIGSIDDVSGVAFDSYSKILSILRGFVGILFFGQFFITIVTKYLLIFHSHLISENVSDDLYIFIARMTNLINGLLAKHIYHLMKEEKRKSIALFSHWLCDQRCNWHGICKNGQSEGQRRTLRHDCHGLSGCHSTPNSH